MSYTVTPHKTGFAVWNGAEIISFTSNEESANELARRLNGSTKPTRRRTPPSTTSAATSGPEPEEITDV